MILIPAALTIATAVWVLSTRNREASLSTDELLERAASLILLAQKDPQHADAAEMDGVAKELERRGFAAQAAVMRAWAMSVRRSQRAR